MNKFIIIFLFVIALSLPAAACAEDKILDIQQIKSASGINAWLVEDHSVPVIAVYFSFKGVGAALDPADKQGLSILVSNTMDEGAGPLNSHDFQKELRDLSISLGFGAGRDTFDGSLKTLTSNKARAFELMKLALTQPRFDEEPLARMRASNESRIRESMTDPEWIAARLQNDRAFGNHPYGLNAGGTLSTLKNITANDLHTFVRTRLGKNLLKIGIAGDIDAAEAAQMIDYIFSTLPVITPPTVTDATLQDAGKTFVFAQDIPQSVIRILQPGISRRDPDYQTFQVMDFILGGSGFGSRLMEEIREKRGLTYGIYTAPHLSNHFNGYSINTSTMNAKTGEVLALTKAEWQRIIDTQPSEKEIQDAKSYLIGSLPLAFNSTDNIASLLQSLQLDELPIDYLEKRNQAIRNTTAADVQRVAKRILSTDSLLTIIVGKPEGLADTVTTIESLPNVQ